MDNKRDYLLEMKTRFYLWLIRWLYNRVGMDFIYAELRSEFMEMFSEMEPDWSPTPASQRIVGNDIFEEVD